MLVFELASVLQCFWVLALEKSSSPPLWTWDSFYSARGYHSSPRFSYFAPRDGATLVLSCRGSTPIPAPVATLWELAKKNGRRGCHAADEGRGQPTYSSGAYLSAALRLERGRRDILYSRPLSPTRAPSAFNATGTGRGERRAFGLTEWSACGRCQRLSRLPPSNGQKG